MGQEPRVRANAPGFAFSTGDSAPGMLHRPVATPVHVVMRCGRARRTAPSAYRILPPNTRPLLYPSTALGGVAALTGQAHQPTVLGHDAGHPPTHEPERWLQPEQHPPLRGPRLRDHHPEHDGPRHLSAAPDPLSSAATWIDVSAPFLAQGSAAEHPADPEETAHV